MSSFPRRRRSYDEQSLLGISAENATTSNHGNIQNPTRIHHQHQHHIMMRGEGIPVVDAHRRQRRRATMTAATNTLLPSSHTNNNNMKVGIFALPSSLPHHHHHHHRPLTLRNILGFASALLLLLVVGDICYFSLTNDDNNNNSTIDDIKELTQTVMRLSQELHDAQLENERNRRRNLENSVNNKAISSSNIEANVGNRHVARLDENDNIMNESMRDKIQKDEKNIIDDATTSSIAEQQREQKQQERYQYQYQGHEQQQQQQQQQEHSSQSGKGRDKHIQLREALTNSIEELDRVRRKQQLQQLQKRTSPIALEEQSSGGSESGGGEEGPGKNKSNNTSNSKSYERLLRGGGIINYLLGDGIETINDYGVGKKEVAFRPGVISDINSDGTFNLFQLESTHPIRNIHREGFRLYQVYTNGTSAFYEQQPKNYVPITIIGYVQSSAKSGLEVHGNYLFTYDADESKAPHEGRAMLMYRYAEDGEIDS